MSIVDVLSNYDASIRCAIDQCVPLYLSLFGFDEFIPNESRNPMCCTFTSKSETCAAVLFNRFIRWSVYKVNFIWTEFFLKICISLQKHSTACGGMPQLINIISASD